jgi:hypothetical protein
MNCLQNTIEQSSIPAKSLFQSQQQNQSNQQRKDGED